MTGTPELHIELEAPSGRARAGELLRGVVRVEPPPDGDPYCESLEVRCRWRATSWSSFHDVGSAWGTPSLFQGAWERGQGYAHPFELRLPNGPCTYRGEEFSLEWEIAAEARIRGGAPIRAENSFVLEPGAPQSGEPYLPGDPSSPHFARLREQHHERSQLGWGTLALFFALALVTLGVGGGGGWMYIDHASLDDPSTFFDGDLLPLVAVALVLTLGLGWLTTMMAKHVFAARRLGGVRLEVPEPRARAGSSIPLHLHLPRASKDLVINRATATLRAFEIIEEGETRSSIFEEVHEVPESAGRRLSAGDSAELALSVPVPRDAPPSLYARFHQVTWEVRVDLDIVGWRAWEDVRAVDIEPYSS